MPSITVPTIDPTMQVRLIVEKPIPLDHRFTAEEARGYFRGMEVIVIKDGKPRENQTVGHKCFAISMADVALKRSSDLDHFDYNIQFLLNEWQSNQAYDEVMKPFDHWNTKGKKKK